MVELLSYLLILVFIVSVVFLGNAHKARIEERKDKLRILEEAVRNNRLDPATRDDLFEVLTGHRPGRRRDPNEPNTVAKVLFTAGWLGIFAGVAFLIGGENDDVQNAGLGFAIASVGLVTLPLALRELQGRKRTT